VKLLKLRNPWGSEKYHGPYSDSDSVWNTGNYAEQVGLVKADDGIFFIDIPTFMSDFTTFMTS
jgi:hypothetical protein